MSSMAAFVYSSHPPSPAVVVWQLLGAPPFETRKIPPFPLGKVGGLDEVGVGWWESWTSSWTLYSPTLCLTYEWGMVLCKGGRSPPREPLPQPHLRPPMPLAPDTHLTSQPLGLLHVATSAGVPRGYCCHCPGPPSWEGAGTTVATWPASCCQPALFTWTSATYFPGLGS